MSTQIRTTVLRRSLGKEGHRQRRRKNDWSEVFESPTWLDSKEFKEYALKVALVLLNADRPLCTRDIHAALGSEAKTDRTQDALEAIRDLGKTGILPTRYFIQDGPVAQPRKQGPGDDLERVFAK